MWLMVAGLAPCSSSRVAQHGPVDGEGAGGEPAGEYRGGAVEGVLQAAAPDGRPGREADGGRVAVGRAGHPDDGDGIGRQGSHGRPLCSGGRSRPATMPWRPRALRTAMTASRTRQNEAALKRASA